VYWIPVLKVQNSTGTMQQKINIKNNVFLILAVEIEVGKCAHRKAAKYSSSLGFFLLLGETKGNDFCLNP
jgi:hypothetical protein